MRLFIIIEKEYLEKTIPENIKGYMGYENDYKLKECVHICRELTDGRFGISVQLKPNDEMFELDNCHSGLNAEEIQLAKDNYGEENLLTIEEFKKLDFKIEN